MVLKLNVLDARSIDEAIKKIDKYIEKLKRLETELPKALCEYGAVQAQAKFDYAVYDVYAGSAFEPEVGTGGGTDIEVHAEPIDNGYAVIANGEKVCFVEFGAGVFYNGGGESYKGTRPEEIAGIGEYGLGKGKKNSWYFTDEFGVVHKTHGTPASNAMYFTSQDMREKVEEIARRILNDD